MHRTLSIVGMLALAVVAAVPVAATSQGGQAPPAQAPPPPPAVKVGDPMPDFTLNYLEPGTERPQAKSVKLSDFKGKQVVVLAFFPAAFSPG
jgi:flagellar basal body-associated protein FliL